MGLIAETNVLQQLKKGQGETNQRLDVLAAEVRRTNQLLEHLIQALTAPRAPQYGPQQYPR